jgi:hypothetical protein
MPRLEVESFTRSENVLVIRIVKDIGPETGIIVFRQVTFMSLPTSMPGETIRVRPVCEAGPDFWARCQLAHDWFDSDDMAFEIESQDGPVYFVVAKTVGYEVMAEPGAAADGGA